MGRASRVYSGTDNIAGLVVADGLTEGTCVVCDGTSQPIGVAVSQAPNGLVNIAGAQEVAFVKAGAAIAFDASDQVTATSDGTVISVNTTTNEDGVWVLGTLVRPTGAAAAEGELVEVAINPYYVEAHAG